ncbi:MAG: nucleotidyltransferase family protein [Ferruginibacter sp.]
MIKEAIILAGGLGTRLKETVPDLPKSLAPISGTPFLKYVIDFLVANNIKRMVFSLGYMHEEISNFVRENYKGLEVEFVVEEEPMGTGGGIALALKKCKDEDVIIVNGDTFFNVDLQKLSSFHKQNTAICTLSLKPMFNFDRYGVVLLDKEGHIQSFLEKQFYAEGLINGGVYALNANKFKGLKMPEKFSFENDFLQKYYPSEKMMGIIMDNYFIDIGIKQDYERAQTELPHQFNKIS